MQTNIDEATPSFNPFSREFIHDPYPSYHQLRKHAPVYRTENLIVLTRYVDIKQVLGSKHFSSSAIPDLFHEFKRKTGSIDYHLISRLARKAIVFTDRPDHTHLRRLVGKCFTRERIVAYEKPFQTLATDIVQTFDTCDNTDFISGVASPYSMRALLIMMDIPQEHSATIDVWTTNLRYLLEPGFLTPMRLRKIYSLLEDCYQFFFDIVQDRKIRTSSIGSDSDLISELCQTRSEDGDSLTDEEVVYSCIMVFVAGRETSKCLLGNGIEILSRYNNEYNKLRSSPEGLPAVINEILRFDSPLQQTKRLCLKNTMINGTKIKKDEQLLLCLGAANRDPDVFDAPDLFNPDRTTSSLAMGHGIHNCLGTQLSKLLAHTLFSTILPLWPKLQLLDVKPPRINSSFILRGFQSLNLAKQ